MFEVEKLQRRRRDKYLKMRDVHFLTPKHILKLGEIRSFYNVSTCEGPIGMKFD